MQTDGRRVRLAHDAVLASWPRASEAAQASREFYRVRAEVEDALRRWQEHGRPKDRLIQPGVPLAEAEKLVERFRRANCRPSSPAMSKASRNRARRRSAAHGGGGGVFLRAGGRRQRRARLAYRAEQRALAAEQRALAERDKATRNFKLAQGMPTAWCSTSPRGCAT